jgi:hypothetical protein
MSGTEKVVGTLAPIEHSLSAGLTHHAQFDRRSVSPLRKRFPGIAAAGGFTTAVALVPGMTSAANFSHLTPVVLCVPAQSPSAVDS